MARLPPSPHAPGGFALLEVLVAFVIAALALGGLAEAALGGLRATAAAGRYEDALARARSHLAAIGHGGPLMPGTQEGSDGGGFAWQSRVTLLATVPVGTADTPDAPRLGLYAVGVEISWGHGRQVTLRSERLAPAPPPTP